MGRNSHYWKNKNDNSEKARLHNEDMISRFKDEIDHSVKHTKIYDKDFIPKTVRSNATHDIRLVDTDSVNAAFTEADGRVCILNFASYKEPGGGFLAGSIAQEECSCHESLLYNVLNAFQIDYYEYNKQHLNRALYHNRALYSEDIIFEHNGESKKCDVLTCAAPNYYAADKYGFVSKEVNSKHIRSRIRFLLSIILDKGNVDTAVLGAFGCGVFGQDPTEVATIFKEEIKNIFGDNTSTKFVFAVINSNNDNYKKFEEVLV